MALDFLADLLFETLLRFAKLLLGLMVELVKGISRAVNVNRRTREANHTLTEYVDAFLFPDEPDRNPSNSSSTPSVLDTRPY